MVSLGILGDRIVGVLSFAQGSLATPFVCKTGKSSLVVESSFNPSMWKAESGNLCEFKVSLVYIESSSLSRDIQRDSVSRKRKERKRGGRRTSLIGSDAAGKSAFRTARSTLISQLCIVLDVLAQS